MDNRGKKCTIMELTHKRQSIIEIKTIKTKLVVRLPIELNQKRSHRPNCSGYYKFSQFSLAKLSKFLILFSAIHTSFKCLVPLNSLLSNSLTSLFSNNQTCFASICNQPALSYLKQTPLNLLNKHMNLRLKSVTSPGRVCLLCKQIRVKIRFVIQLLPTIAEFPSHLK